MNASPNPLKFIGPKQIVSSIDSNKVLDIEAGSYNERAKLQIWDNNKTLNKKFFIEKIGYSEFIIRAAHSNLVLGVEGGPLDISDAPICDTRRVIQLSQNNGNNQKWILEDAENGFFFIRNTLGWYLDVYRGSVTNGNAINIHPFNGTTAQQFKII